jgi:hypothetical protein
MRQCSRCAIITLSGGCDRKQVAHRSAARRLILFAGIMFEKRLTLIDYFLRYLGLNIGSFIGAY